MPYIRIKKADGLSPLLFTGISESSLERIHSYKEWLLPLVDSIVDELYLKIYELDYLKKIIDKYTTLDRLKVTQREYLKQVFSPIIDDEYIQNRYKIGETHSRVGLELNWFIATTQQYSLIVSSYLNRFLPPEEALTLTSCINSVINFDMQIIVVSYNKVEIKKAEFPLRYEFRHLQSKSGFNKSDIEILKKYSGLFTFRLHEVLSNLMEKLLQKSALLQRNDSDIKLLMPYLERFFLQFFQEKVYEDEAVFYRIIRDWVGVMVNRNISDQKVTAIIDTLNEVMRDTFLLNGDKLESDYYVFIASFERLSRFTLAIICELLIPYRSLKDYQFLQTYSYEIDKIDFGKITWVDENTVQLLKSRGLGNQEIVEKRCFELFYDRIFPCRGCPVRNNSFEAFLTSYEKDAVRTYFKTWQLPQSKVGGLSHSLLVSQDVTEESLIIFNMVERLLELAELRDDMTGTHVERIGMLSGKLAQLAGLDEKFISHIQLAAKFHDVGKVGIPDAILNKPGKLTPEEWESMKTHPTIGYQILSKLELPVIEMAARIAATHHEKWNGEGYPLQLKGEEIPIEGRIVAIVDVFDALLSKRAYKDPIPHEKVKGIMIEGRGNHFDPNLLDLFLSMWENFIEFHQRMEEGTPFLNSPKTL
ncbi:HD domain-containing phosphohydrolase [Schinkia sp. CFF1]